MRRIAQQHALAWAANEIGPDGATAIAEALALNSTVTAVYLSGACCTLCRGFCNEANRSHVCCAGNGIGSAGMAAVAKMLRVNAALTAIDLSSKLTSAVSWPVLHARAHADGRGARQTTKLGRRA